jgi:hypothetical protein
MVIRKNKYDIRSLLIVTIALGIEENSKDETKQ